MQARVGNSSNYYISFVEKDRLLLLRKKRMDVICLFWWESSILIVTYWRYYALNEIIHRQLHYITWLAFHLMCWSEPTCLYVVAWNIGNQWMFWTWSQSEVWTKPLLMEIGAWNIEIEGHEYNSGVIILDNNLLISRYHTSLQNDKFS